MKTLSSLFIAVAALALGTTTGGCTADTPNSDEEASSEALTAIAPPSGVYIAQVSALGTGCPSHSAHARLSDDSESFRISFDDYEATVRPGEAFAIADCAIVVDVRVPSGFRYAVSSLHLDGDVVLADPEMVLEQSTKAYFSGNPLPATEQKASVFGPTHEALAFNPEVEPSDLVWSRCTANRSVIIQTRISLQNNATKTGRGRATVTSVSDWKLRWGRC